MKTKNTKRYIWIAVVALVLFAVIGRMVYTNLLKSDDPLINLLESEKTPLWVKQVFIEGEHQ